MATMREPTYLVLTALSNGTKHGYAIMRDVETLSAGAVLLRAGTLYAALDRLLAEGLVSIESEGVVEGRFRRYYRLSTSGREALRDEARHLARLAAQAQRRLRAAESRP